MEEEEEEEEDDDEAAEDRENTVHSFLDVIYILYYDLA